MQNFAFKFQAVAEKTAKIVRGLLYFAAPCTRVRQTVLPSLINDHTPGLKAHITTILTQCDVTRHFQDRQEHSTDIHRHSGLPEIRDSLG